MIKARKPELDNATLQIAKRILSMPPKQHKDMKVGKRKAKASEKAKPLPMDAVKATRNKK